MDDFLIFWHNLEKINTFSDEKESEKSVSETDIEVGCESKVDIEVGEVFLDPPPSFFSNSSCGSNWLLL